jgi:hypothetical protein
MWNYRVCKGIHSKGTEHEEVFHAIREVYYNSEGDITAISTVDSPVYGSDIHEIEAALDYMKNALEKPIIDLDNIKYSPR